MQNPMEKALRDGAASLDARKSCSEPEETFSHQMLTFPLRQYVIEKCKEPLYKLILMVAKRWPRPTRRNCRHPNTLVWIDILDRFMAMEDTASQREDLFKAINKIFIAEYEHDHSYYGERIDVILELWLEEVLKGNYKPRSKGYPHQYWKVDPNKRGPGYDFINEKYRERE